MTETLTDRDMGDETELSREAAKVINWRQQWLRSAGYSKRNAELIASDSRIDLHMACEILPQAIEKGYDEDYVVKLLL